MSHRKHLNNSQHNSQRDASDVARRPTDVNKFDFRDPRPLTEIRRLLNTNNNPPPIDVRTDKRTFNPVTRPIRIINSIINTNRRPLMTVRRQAQKFYRKQKQLAGQSLSRDIYSPRDWMEHPRETMVCLRRKVRKEVLFSFRKKGGKGSGSRRRYNDDTLIKCRR